MEDLAIATLGDLVEWHGSGEIICPLKAEVVRRIEVDGKLVIVRSAAGEGECYHRGALIFYRPWVMDRGSLLLPHPVLEWIKLCTEFDIFVPYDRQKTRKTIVPARPYLEAAGPKSMASLGAMQEG